MSAAVKAAKSVVWMFLGGAGANVAGLVGTMVLVHYVAPLDYGEASAAAVIVGTAQQLSTVAIGQFVVVKAKERADLAFTALVVHLGLGVLGMFAVFALKGPLGEWISAPGMSRFVLGFIVAAAIDRISVVPERTLMMTMRFRVVAFARTLGEFAYTGVSVALAVLGWGGFAIAIGNVARSLVRAVLVIGASDRRKWLVFQPIRRESVNELFRFGLPIAVGGFAGFVSKRWDNLLVSRFFGPSTMAEYNLAFNLAEAPPTIVADQVADVLLPSFASLPPTKRGAPLLRSLALLSLVMCPLVVGLGAVATTAVEAFLGPKWLAVGPMLAVMSAMSVTRPLTWTCNTFFQAADKPRAVMMLELVNVALILGSIVTVGRLGPLWACAAVGLASGARAFLSALVVRSLEGISLARFFAPQVGPLFACVPMVIAILVLRPTLGHLVPQAAIRLAIEVLVGAVVFVPFALLLARPTVRDAIDLGRRALRRTKPSDETLVV